MSDLLGIGASGVASYGKALGVIGENIANANTAGYVRRDVALTAQGAGAAGITDRGTTAGNGVSVAGVTRAADAFRIADARLTSADAASADARSTWLAAAETALPDTDGGIGTSLTSVYTAGAALAADPDSTLPRQTFLSAIDSAAGAFRSGAAGLASVSAGIAADAAGNVATLNGALGSLAKINASILRAQPGTSNAATLADQRDAAIDTIAKSAGVSVALDPRGVATVTLAGTTTVLADARGTATVQLAQASDGRLSLSIDNGTTAVQPTTGALSGLVDAASAVAGRRRQLDGIANDFSAKLNAWSQGGTDANGNGGAALLTTDAGAAGIRLIADDPATVAASDGDAANGNALALSTQRGSDGAEARAAALVAGLSQTVAAAKSENSAAAARADSAVTARDAGSAVDLDREAADLLRFQQAYGAAAKVIQTSRETLQSILNLF